MNKCSIGLILSIAFIYGCNFGKLTATNATIVAGAYVGDWSQCDGSSWNSKSFGSYQPSRPGFQISVTDSGNNILLVEENSSSQPQGKALAAMSQDGFLWVVENDNDVHYRCMVADQKIHCVGFESGDEGWVATTTLCKQK